MSRIPLSSQLSFRLVTAASDNGFRTVKQFQLALHGQLQNVVVFWLRGNAPHVKPEQCFPVLRELICQPANLGDTDLGFLSGINTLQRRQRHQRIGSHPVSVRHPGLRQERRGFVIVIQRDGHRFLRRIHDNTGPVNIDGRRAVLAPCCRQCE